MSKCNLSEEQLKRAADIVGRINSVDRMTMFLNYVNAKNIDIEKTNEEKLLSMKGAFDCGLYCGIMWLFNKLGAEAFELFDKNEKEDDGRGVDRL